MSMLISPKNLAIKHQLTGLIIQGLKEIGESKVDERKLSNLKKIIFQSNEVSQIKSNIRYAPVWIQKIVLKIINDLIYEQMAKPILE